MSDSLHIEKLVLIDGAHHLFHVDLTADDCAAIVQHAQMRQQAQAKGEAVERGWDAASRAIRAIVAMDLPRPAFFIFNNTTRIETATAIAFIAHVRSGKIPGMIWSDDYLNMKQIAIYNEEIATLRAKLEESTASFKAMREARATHRCKVCSALWVKHPGEGGWSLCSDICGKCCDVAVMGDQIEAIGVTAERDYLRAQVEALARERNEALTKHSDQKLTVERLRIDIAKEKAAREAAERKISGMVYRTELAEAWSQRDTASNEAHRLATELAQAQAERDAALTTGHTEVDAAREQADKLSGLLRRVAAQSRGIAARDAGLVQITVVAEPLLKEIDAALAAHDVGKEKTT